jgi:hypothetical protein
MLIEAENGILSLYFRDTKYLLISGGLMGSVYFGSMAKYLLKTRSFHKALMETNLGLRPFVLIKFLSCVCFSECLLQYNRASFYHNVDIESKLDYKIKNSIFDVKLTSKENNNNFDGDYSEWYKSVVLEEIKYLTMTNLYHEQIFNLKKSNENIKKNIKTLPHTSVILNWDKEGMDTENFYSEEKSTNKSLLEKLQSNKITKKGISGPEFDFLWKKYNSSLN